MKNYCIYFLYCFFYLSCAQNDKSNSVSLIPVSEKHKHITAKNFVEEMTKQVKHFKKEPRYFIRPIQTNCVFEVLVNGVLTYKDYTIEKLSSPKSINHAILKSGPQVVTVRMYPIGDAIKDAYSKGETITTLQSNSNVSIKVVKYEAFNISDELDDEIIVTQHNSPTNKKTDEFIGEGLPYYEYAFTFNAEVPYELEGWSNGEDLTKFDKEDLEEAVVSYYKNYQNIYKNKDEDLLAKTAFGDIFIISQGKYKNKREIQSAWDEMRGNLYYADKDFEILENYVVDISFDKKTVVLKHPSLTPVDDRLRGESSFWFKYTDEENDTSAFFSYIYSYIPKGGTVKDLRRID
jgi:hypothetical protein